MWDLNWKYTLHGPLNNPKPVLPGNRHISETYNDRLHHQLLIQAPDRAQNHSPPLVYQQNVITTINGRKIDRQNGKQYKP